MKMRDEEQLQLKFQEHPLPQTMGILAGKFMNEQNFRHPTFGPMLEVYSQECLRRSFTPTVPYILNSIASWYDTSSGGSIAERDLYAVKCVGKSMRELTDFMAQVDYVMLR